MKEYTFPLKSGACVEAYFKHRRISDTIERNKHGGYISEDAIIHPEAKIDASAVILSGAKIRWGCVIGPGVLIGIDAEIDFGVTIGSGSAIYNNAKIGYETTIGKNNIIGEHTQIGKFVTIGRENVISDFDAIADYAKVGNNNYFRAHVKVRDDAQIGDKNFFERSTQIGADALVGDRNVVEGALLKSGVLLEESYVANGTVGKGSEIVKSKVNVTALEAGSVIYRSAITDPTLKGKVVVKNGRGHKAATIIQESVERQDEKR